MRPQISHRVIGGLVLGAFIALLWAERRWPLRRRRENAVRHGARNLAMAGLSALAIHNTERPLNLRLTNMVERRGWGLLKRAALPAPLEDAIGVVLLDYTLYLWHVLTHKMPLLWRFHQAHHVDLDLTASTALRFHCGEMLLSVPWRAAQILLIGIGPRTLSLWQTATLIEILFHHSNLRLPHHIERWLCHVVVTPRMHGIHHSIVEDETSSNWSTIFTWPDRLHGTLRLNIPQQAITTGVPAFQEADDVDLPAILLMPATPERRSWQLPGNGKPQRQALPAPATSLAK